MNSFSNSMVEIEEQVMHGDIIIAYQELADSPRNIHNIISLIWVENPDFFLG